MIGKIDPAEVVDARGDCAYRYLIVMKLELQLLPKKIFDDRNDALKPKPVSEKITKSSA